MKLDPNQVRLLTPFLPGLTRRRLRFAGKRNAVHLQETALVVEGDLLRFHYLGFERLFAGAVCEWTTVTVPYSRITRVKYRSRLLLRLAILLPILGMAGLIASGVLTTAPNVFEVVSALVALAVPVVVLWLLVWRGLGPTYTILFRAKDGTPTDFTLRVRSKPLRKQFEAALARYRDAARRFATERHHR